MFPRALAVVSLFAVFAGCNPGVAHHEGDISQLVETTRQAQTSCEFGCLGLYGQANDQFGTCCHVAQPGCVSCQAAFAACERAPVAHGLQPGNFMLENCGNAE